MSNNLNLYKKAKTLAEIDNAVRLDVPITPDHEFYTDFSDVRGDFEDRMIYKTLNVHPKTFIFNREINQGNKVMLFLAGMRGSGKTSELAKIAKKLHNKDCFFCVTCNLDDGLDLNDMEYMDILIFQLERLFQQLDTINLSLDKDILSSLYDWFGDRVKEVNKSIKIDGGLEISAEAKTPSFLNFFSFLSMTAKLKANLAGSKENADKIRTVFKNNFTQFSQKFNEFIEHVNMILRKQGVAQELIFIVDGLEKVATVDIRKKIILEETNRIRQIKVNSIFTLPIEMMPQREKLNDFSTVVSFPFVKIREKNGTIIEEAISRFQDFVSKRIDISLFDSPETVRKAILFGGGSPRELLRILEYANMFADEDTNKIYLKDLDKGIKKLSAQTSQYVSNKDLEKLKILKEANEKEREISFDEDWQDLLEKLIVLEYNDGTYKRVNPIVEASPLYKQDVG
jgi:KAP family P-loop domain